MKKIKLICLILCIVVILPVFPSYGAIYSTIPVYESDYENSLSVLKTICPDFPLNDKDTTTRAEFVTAVCMMLNMPSGSAPEIPFSDVGADSIYAPYISYATNMGLISNVDLFYPNKPITWEQAIKIVVSAIGYGKKAEMLGGYPSGYIRCALDAGVGTGMNMLNSQHITHSDAIKLVFEASITDLMEASSFGASYDYTVTEGKNILSVYHGIYMAEGVVTANEYTGLRSITSASPYGYIEIDGISYKGNYSHFIGKNIRAFYKDNSKNEILIAYECENKIYNYNSVDAPILTGDAITVYDEAAYKEIAHKLENSYTVIYNGKCFNTASPQSVINSSSDLMELIDNNDNGIIDVVNIKKYDYSVVGSVNEFDEKIYDKFKKGGTYNLSDYTYTITDTDGNSLELWELDEDDAIGFAFSKDKKLCEIIKYNSKVGGIINSFTSDGKIIVGENEFELSDYYIANVKPLSMLKLGGEVILHVGECNKVIYVQEFSSDMNYGFFVASAPGSGLSSEPKVLIFGEDGEMHELSLAEKVKVNGVQKNQSEAFGLCEAIKDKELLMRVVKYSLNASGCLSKIYTAKANSLGTGVFLTHTPDEEQPVLYDDNTKHGYVETSGSSAGKLVFKNDVFYPYFPMATDCVILKVPKNEGERLNNKYYSLSQSSEVKEFSASNGDSVECYGYDVDMDGVSFILWPSDVGGAANVAEETSNAIVEDVTKGISPDGTECYTVKLFADGKAEKYYSMPDSESVVLQMKPGDIVQVSYNAEKEITAANINFVWKTKTIGGNAQAPQGFNGARVGLAAGYFYNFSGKTGMIVRNKTINEIANASTSFDFTDVFPANLGRGKLYFVKFNYNRNGEITDAVVYTESDTSSIESFYTSGKDADYMVQRARFHDIIYTVVYVN